MASPHLAQLNIARLRAPLDDPLMADFVSELPRINALAEAAPGFVWRLRDEDAPDATTLRPFGPDVLVNLSVWESVETLRDFTYRGAHLEPLSRRREWFVRSGMNMHIVLWWVPARHVPTVDEARQRLELLESQGPTPAAFTLRQPYPASTWPTALPVSTDSPATPLR